MNVVLTSVVFSIMERTRQRSRAIAFEGEQVMLKCRVHRQMLSDIRSE